MDAFVAGKNIKIKNSEITLTQQKQDYKPLEFCSSEELIDERKHRRHLLKKEHDSKFKQAKPLIIIAGVFGVSSFILSYFFGDLVNPLITGFTALGTVLSLAGSGSIFQENDFQKRQQQTIELISILLKERQKE